MRFSTFVVGGLVGAAAAVYLSRSNKPAMFSNLGRSGKKMLRKFEPGKSSDFAHQVKEMLECDSNDKVMSTH